MVPKFFIKNFIDHYGDPSSFKYNGLWSLLLTRNKEETADFARRYFDDFNKISTDGWNLCVCANFDPNRYPSQWFDDEKFFEYEKLIREQLIFSGVTVPDMAIIFYDPHDEYLGITNLIIPINNKAMQNKILFKRAFEGIQSDIMSSADELHINIRSEITSDDYKKIINRLQGKLERRKLLSFISMISSPVGNAFLGALVGKFVS
ncbi:hypothetical protein JK176_03455 [Gluconobacter sp. Dm-73]|uniref:hypothetical protein n=1 Tax=Gluconobacter sp. Dm-73 TaxID=2799802 RepID=UPI001B8B4CB3|nr:hypothetical protein [Gluconobacter sp. Dm-73]MBS1073932.1 hypothetical protein [Gluconobacter sp. Dm-73]